MNVIKVIVMMVTLFVVILSLSILADQMLGLMGYPSAREIQITHPGNFQEKRNNIEFDVDFKTNSKGLRYKDLPLDKKNGEIRFIVLGDSFVEGEGVQSEDTFSSLLEKTFTDRYGKNFRFINGGLSNTGPLQYLRLLKYVGLQYQPDYVLICVYANDVSDTPEYLTSQDFYRIRTHDYASKAPGLRRFLHWMLPRLYTKYELLRDQLRDGTPPDGFVEKVEFFARRSNISEDKIRIWREKLRDSLVEYADAGRINASLISYPLLRPAYWTTGLDVATPQAKRKFDTMSSILDEIVRLARSEDVPAGLVFIPAVWQYDPRAYESGHPMVEGGMVRKAWLTERTEVQKRLETWALSRSVPFLDLTDYLRRKVVDGQTLNYPLDLHWNPAGHAATAEAIGPWLETDILSPVPVD